MKSGVLGANSVCMAFLKQIAGGDVMAEGIWLANVLYTLTEQRCWVLKSSTLIAVGHGPLQDPQLHALQKEEDFCISLLWKESWNI